MIDFANDFMSDECIRPRWLRRQANQAEFYAVQPPLSLIMLVTKGAMVYVTFCEVNIHWRGRNEENTNGYQCQLLPQPHHTAVVASLQTDCNYAKLYLHSAAALNNYDCVHQKQNWAKNRPLRHDKC